MKLALILIALPICLIGCKSQPINEHEAHVRAVELFKRDLKVIYHYQIDKFSELTFDGASKSNTGELWYSYISISKFYDVRFVIGISEFGDENSGTIPIEK